MKKFIYLLLFVLSTHLAVLPVAHAEDDREFYPPKILFETMPQYPIEASVNGYEGDVLLKFIISENGRVEDVKVTKSSGYEILDNEAIRSIKEWKFIPARLKSGESIKSAAEKLFAFKLSAEKEEYTPE